MAWSEDLQNAIDATLTTYPHREVLCNAIASLINAKIEQAFYNANLGGASVDPDQSVDYYERLLAAVIDELHKDKP